MPPEHPIRSFGDRAAWAEWLELHHASEPGIWLRLAKKGSGISSVSFAEALEVALCYGWIDGQGRRFDDETWLQKFTRRGKRSTWSKRNREHAERLIRDGHMRLAGLAAVEAARADGRWERAYDSPATATVPEDLASALDALPGARLLFDALNKSERYAILHGIQTAVRPETRQRRIERAVARFTGP